MADAVIVWSDDPEVPGNVLGLVSGVKYFRIFPGWSPGYYHLSTALPLELDTGTRAEGPEELKALATAHLSKFVGAMHGQMVEMGLLT